MKLGKRSLVNSYIVKSINISQKNYVKLEMQSENSSLALGLTCTALIKKFIKINEETI